MNTQSPADDNTRSIQYAAGLPRLTRRHGHPLDRNLPGHWEGIRSGQTFEERSAAILVNIKLDELRRGSDMDPATRHRIITPSEAVARLSVLTRKLPS